MADVGTVSDKQGNYQSRKAGDDKHKLADPKRGRKYERKSGTGYSLRSNAKRSGKGAYNWGDDMDEEVLDEEVEAGHEA